MAEATVRIATERLSAMYGKITAVKDVTLGFATNRVHALIGPSGCGKSTFLRSLNRMHELTPGGWITGRVLLDGQGRLLLQGESDAAAAPGGDGLPEADPLSDDVDLR